MVTPPRLKLLGHRGHIKIYSVDGVVIRSEIDREFTNFGQHYHFSFIPKNEFWIDHESAPDERRFFIDHLLVEWQLMKQGNSYDRALVLADAKERAERFRSNDFLKVINPKGIPDAAKVHQKCLSAPGSKICVWLVNGRLVRSVFFVDFTEGGHDLVYDFVPPGEIWLDNDLAPADLPYVLLHEAYERSLMYRGFAYHQAHRQASRLEWSCRHRPSSLLSSLSRHLPGSIPDFSKLIPKSKITSSSLVP
ncbi:MAG: hypothetical protein WC686_03795 [Candidatus Shapirobacteria bacterium]|jgi:hypothetical protein